MVKNLMMVVVVRKVVQKVAGKVVWKVVQKVVFVGSCTLIFLLWQCFWLRTIPYFSFMQVLRRFLPLFLVWAR